MVTSGVARQGSGPRRQRAMRLCVVAFAFAAGVVWINSTSLSSASVEAPVTSGTPRVRGSSLGEHPAGASERFVPVPSVHHRVSRERATPRTDDAERAADGTIPPRRVHIVVGISPFLVMGTESGEWAGTTSAATFHRGKSLKAALRRHRARAAVFDDLLAEGTSPVGAEGAFRVCSVVRLEGLPVRGEASKSSFFSNPSSTTGEETAANLTRPRDVAAAAGHRECGESSPTVRTVSPASPGAWYTTVVDTLHQIASAATRDDIFIIFVEASAAPNTLEAARAWVRAMVISAGRGELDDRLVACPVVLSRTHGVGSGSVLLRSYTAAADAALQGWFAVNDDVRGSAGASHGHDNLEETETPLPVCVGGRAEVLTRAMGRATREAVARPEVRDVLLFATVQGFATAAERVSEAAFLRDGDSKKLLPLRDAVDKAVYAVNTAHSDFSVWLQTAAEQARSRLQPSKGGRSTTPVRGGAEGPSGTDSICTFEHQLALRDLGYLPPANPVLNRSSSHVFHDGHRYPLVAVAASDQVSLEHQMDGLLHPVQWGMDGILAAESHMYGDSFPLPDPQVVGSHHYISKEMNTDDVEALLRRLATSLTRLERFVHRFERQVRSACSDASDFVPWRRATAPLSGDAPHNGIVLPVSVTLTLTTASTASDVSLPWPLGVDNVHSGGEPPTPSPTTWTNDEAATSLVHPSSFVTTGAVVAWTGPCCYCCGFSSELAGIIRELSSYVRTVLSVAPTCHCMGLRPNVRAALVRGYLSRSDTTLIRQTVMAAAGPSSSIGERPVSVLVVHWDPVSADARLPRPGRRSDGQLGTNAHDVVVCRTMTEFDAVGENAVTLLNRDYDEVWVPSQAAKDAYVRSGVRPQSLVVVPEAVDVDVFRPPPSSTTTEQHPSPSNHPALEYLEGADVPYHANRGSLIGASSSSRRHSEDKRPFKVLLSMLKWEARKGVDVLLRAYLSAFTARDPVCLLVLSMWHGGADGDEGGGGDSSAMMKEARRIAVELGIMADQDMPMIAFVSKHLDNDVVAAMFRTSDSFVLPTRGEGWGLPIAQAMASELPTITTLCTGVTAYASEENVYPVKFTLAAPPVEVAKSYGVPTGARWCEPDVDNLVTVLRHVALDASRQELAQKGRLARTAILRFAPANVAKVIAEHVKRLEELVRANRSSLPAPAQRREP